MQTSPLLKFDTVSAPLSEMPQRSVDHNKVFRACVLNAVPIPAQTLAVLEARGVDVGELETRIRESIGFRR